MRARLSIVARAHSPFFRASFLFVVSSSHSLLASALPSSPPSSSACRPSPPPKQGCARAFASVLILSLLTLVRAHLLLLAPLWWGAARKGAALQGKIGSKKQLSHIMIARSQKKRAKPRTLSLRKETEECNAAPRTRTVEVYPSLSSLYPSPLRPRPQRARDVGAPHTHGCGRSRAGASFTSIDHEMRTEN